MPASVQKVNGKYRVSTPNRTHAFGTSKAKAERQARLLRAIDHGWKPTGKAAQEAVRAAALRVVDRLLEVDEISSVPIPASGKRYARLRGMGGLRKKQQLYIDMSRDLGNRLKPTKGFPNREGSAYTARHESFNPPFIGVLTETFVPTGAQTAWAERLLSSFDDGAYWVIPATGQVYRISHQAKTLTLVEGDPNDADGWHEMNKVLFAKVGYRVLDAPETSNSDEMSFAEDMDSAPVSQALERHHTEKTKLGGGSYGKHVDPKNKTAGKFKFPANFKVGHAMKGQ